MRALQTCQPAMRTCSTSKSTTKMLNLYAAEICIRSVHHLQAFTRQWHYARSCCCQQQQNLPYSALSSHSTYINGVLYVVRAEMDSHRRRAVELTTLHTVEVPAVLSAQQ
jgi:hypothetical protein